MDFLMGLFEGNLVAQVLAIMVSANVILASAQKALSAFMDLTETDLDNKAHSLIGKVMGFLKKVVEFAGANTTDKK